jgi:hypothetical protein
MRSPYGRRLRSGNFLSRSAMPEHFDVLWTRGRGVNTQRCCDPCKPRFVPVVMPLLLADMIAIRNHRNITIELKRRHRIISDAVGHQHDALTGADGEEPVREAAAAFEIGFRSTARTQSAGPIKPRCKRGDHGASNNLPRPCTGRIGSRRAGPMLTLPPPVPPRWVQRRIWCCRTHR